MITLVGWDKAIHVLLCMVFVSIPEEIFVIMFTLLLLRQFDFLESNKEGENYFKKIDIARIALIVIFIAFVSNIFRFYLNLDPVFGSLLLVALTVLSIVILYQLYWNVVDIFKTLVCTIVSMMTIAIMEALYVPIVLHYIDKTVEEVNNTFFLHFLLSLPERILQFAIIVYALAKKKTFIKAKVVNLITRSRQLMMFTSVFLLVNVSVFVVFSLLVIYGRILKNYSMFVQLGFIVFIIILPIINLLIYFGVIIYKDNKEAKDRFTIRQDLEATLKDAKRFLNSGNHDKLNVLVNDLDSDIKRVYKNYEKEMRA